MQFVAYFRNFHHNASLDILGVLFSNKKCNFRYFLFSFTHFLWSLPSGIMLHANLDWTSRSMGWQLLGHAVWKLGPTNCVSLPDHRINSSNADCYRSIGPWVRPQWHGPECQPPLINPCRMIEYQIFSHHWFVSLNDCVDFHHRPMNACICPIVHHFSHLKLWFVCWGSHFPPIISFPILLVEAIHWYLFQWNYTACNWVPSICWNWYETTTNNKVLFYTSIVFQLLTIEVKFNGKQHSIYDNDFLVALHQILCAYDKMNNTYRAFGVERKRIDRDIRRNVLLTAVSMF